MQRSKQYFVYFLSNWNNKVLYVGVTNNLIRRVCEHKQGDTGGFASKYNLSKLVYYEQTEDIYTAISREKQIKKWRRSKKDDLVNSMNVQWKDLYEEICR